MKLKISLESVMRYILITSIILSASSMYGVVENLHNMGISSYTFRKLTMITAALFILLLLKKRMMIKKKQMMLICFVILYLGIYLLFTRINVTSALEGMCIPFVLFLTILVVKDPKVWFVEVLGTYENIVVFMAGMSLVFYFGGVIFHIIPSMSMHYYNNGWWYSGDNYFYLHFTNHWQTYHIFGRTFMRNVGVFMEGPGFAVHLLIAVWWCLFGHGRLKKARAVILFTTLITTFTTKAFLIGAVITFIYIYSHASDKARFWKKVRWGVFPLVFAVVSVFSLYVLKTKIASSAPGAGSWYIRMVDYAAAFKTWLDYPLFGAGFYNLQAVYEYYPSSFLRGDPTAGILNIFAYGGIYMFMLYFIGLWKYYAWARHSPSGYVVKSFMIMVLMLLFTSAMQYSYYFLLILSIGLSLSVEDRMSVLKKIDYFRG